jgi:hypothetical protein
MAGPGLLAHVLVAKYADHRPLYLQSSIYAREGVDLERPTLADLVGQCAALLRPLVNDLQQHVLGGTKIHADNTPVPVLAPGEGKAKTGRLWIYVREDRQEGDANAPAVRFAYSTNHQGEHPEGQLRPFGSRSSRESPADSATPPFLSEDQGGVPWQDAMNQKEPRQQVRGKCHSWCRVAWGGLIAPKSFLNASDLSTSQATRFSCKGLTVYPQVKSPAYPRVFAREHHDGASPRTRLRSSSGLNRDLRVSTRFASPHRTRLRPGLGHAVLVQRDPQFAGVDQRLLVFRPVADR